MRALDSSDSILSISGTTFKKLSVNNQGAGLRMNNGNLKIFNSTFK